MSLATGLDAIHETPSSRPRIRAEFGVPLDEPPIVVTFHHANREFEKTEQ